MATRMTSATYVFLSEQRSHIKTQIGIYLGPNLRDGDAFTYLIYCPNAKSVTSRTIVSTDPTTIPYHLPSSVAFQMFRDKRKKIPVKEVPVIIDTKKIIKIKEEKQQHGTIQVCSTDGTTGNHKPNVSGKSLIPGSRAS